MGLIHLEPQWQRDFSCPAMTAPADPIARTHEHVVVGDVRNGEEVGRHLHTLLAFVHVGHAGPVDGQLPVGVDCHAEQA